MSFFSLLFFIAAIESPILVATALALRSNLPCSGTCPSQHSLPPDVTPCLNGKQHYARPRMGPFETIVGALPWQQHLRCLPTIRARHKATERSSSTTLLASDRACKWEWFGLSLLRPSYGQGWWVGDIGPCDRGGMVGQWWWRHEQTCAGHGDMTQR